jgi:hypothetical protein
MATVASSRSRGNRSLAAAFSLSPILAHALAVGARKPASESRGDLAPGAYEVSARLEIVGTLTVGEDSETSATATPDTATLVGLILGKLNGQTRAAICRDVAAEFIENGCEYPPVDETIVAQAEDLMASLRRKVSQHRRGAVSGHFSIKHVGGSASNPLPLSVVG